MVHYIMEKIIISRIIVLLGVAIGLTALAEDPPPTNSTVGGSSTHKFHGCRCAAPGAALLGGLHGSLGESRHGFLSFRRRAMVEKQPRAARQIALGILHRTGGTQLVFDPRNPRHCGAPKRTASPSFAPARGRRFLRLGHGYQPD